MTPPANPSIASSNRSGAFLTKRAGNAPKPVAKPAARLARKPAVMRSRTLFSTKTSQSVKTYSLTGDLIAANESKC